MTNFNLFQLGAKLYGDRSSDLDSSIRLVEGLLPLSNNYRSLLRDFGGAIIFDNGAKFKCDEPSPLINKEGYQGLEILYGLGDGKDSIQRKSKQYSDQLPDGYFPIGESSGGNLVCLDRQGHIFLWDHESDRLSRIASSVDEFLQKLEPDDREIGNTDGIIESESFLDF